MRHIRKTFPGVVALDNVDLELQQGAVHILLGENGAGKSTLVKILSGAYRMTSGQIIINGRETAINNPRHAQQLGIGIIYQELNLIPQLTAAENIFLGRESTLKSGLLNQQKMDLSADLLLRELGVEIDIHCPISALGVAQQQMVEVAKALSWKARILIMDEPTSALTRPEIKELFKTIRRLKKKGVAVIYISHRLEELFEIGDQVTVLRDGHSIGCYNIADVDQPQLIRLMVDRELHDQLPKVQAERGPEVLRVEGLCRRDVLHDISFTLYGGEVLGIAGLMGSGRTELARALFGIDPIDSGQLFIRGAQTNIGSPRAAIKQGIGFLTEDRKSEGLVMGLTVKENICLASVERLSRLWLVDSQGERRAASGYVQDLRIRTTGLEQRVMFLSGGNQQKVVLSKWLCCRADILIFDEPTRGIDVGSKVEIYQLLNRLTAGGTAVLMISSELPEIIAISDRILVMRHGRIAGEFTAAEATQELIMECALGVANAA